MRQPMFERLRWVFAECGLTDGYDVQLVFFEDPEDENVSVILFGPAGGGALRYDLGTTHIVRVVLIGARTRRRETTEHAQRILDFFQNEPTTFGCLGYIEPTSALPAPMLTEEGRIVYELSFLCTFGE